MYEIKFADIGEGIHEGVIFKIEVELGQSIDDGDTLYLVETDKVTADIPSPVGGTVKYINFKQGDTIHVGDVIMVIDDGTHSQEQEVEHEIVSEQGSTSVVGDLEISSELIASSEEVTVESTLQLKKILATPVSRKLAKDLNIDIQTVVGTGPAGRVMKADILSLTKKDEVIEPSRSVEKVVKSEVLDERLPMSQVRKAIAGQMIKSRFTIPHTSVMDEIEVTDLVAYRNKVKVIASNKGIKLTYLPFIIKAVATALKQHRIINSQLDDSTMEIVFKKGIHIGIAVDTEYGLTVPVIQNADQLSILEIASAIDDLSKRAQNKELKLSEITDSTFTITNYGALGSSFGVPVINYPNAAILGIGMISKKPVVKEDNIVIGHILPLSMSFDHRIIDGADAGRFMQTVKALLTQVELLLLS